MNVQHVPFVRVAIPAMTLVWQLAAPVSGLAQAWLPAKGEGSISIIFQDEAVRRHTFQNGERLDRGHIQSETMLVDATYGLTDKLTVSVTLPYVASKYTGDFPHLSPFQATIDTGAYHSTLQDFRFDVRYNVFKGPVVITPFIGTIVPSHDYVSFGHSAVGRDLREVQIGAYVARHFDAVLPGVFVQGRYSYGFTERALDISHNRSNMDLEVGYFVRPSFRVFGLAVGQVTHGGLDFPTNFRDIATPEQWFHHDQIGRDNRLNLGAGAALSLSESLDLFGSAIHTMAARNNHAIEYGLTLGVTYSFTKGAETILRNSSGQKHLVRCLCEKNAS